MKFARPFFPTPSERAHVIAGLELLASHIEDYPHHFRVQQESRALLSPADLRQVAAALADPNYECLPEAPFFSAKSVRASVPACWHCPT